MSNDSSHEVDLDRRRFLSITTGVVGGLGAAVAAVPFLASWQPSAKAQAAGAPVEVDISHLKEGERLVIEWRGRPVWIIKRSPKAMSRVSELSTDILKDPNSASETQQPAYASNAFRARESDPEVLVLEGVCTHLGCSPLYEPEPTANLSAGGFFCPCHGSKFDLAGRVYKGVPAGENLKVPPFQFLGETKQRVLIGDDSRAA